MKIWKCIWRVNYFLFLIALLCSIFSCKNKNIDVNFDLDILIDKEYNLCVTGNTNLPNETELLLTLMDGETEEILGQTKTTVKENKLFFEPLCPDSIGIGNGKYKIQINLGLPTSQPKSVQKIIGSNGEYLSGKYCFDVASQKSIQYREFIDIDGSPLRTLADRRNAKK